MTSKDIREILERVVVGIDLELLNDDELFSEFGIDSLDYMNFLVAIEVRYNVKIPDEDLDDCNSISKLLNFLKK